MVIHQLHKVDDVNINQHKNETNALKYNSYFANGDDALF